MMRFHCFLVFLSLFVQLSLAREQLPVQEREEDLANDDDDDGDKEQQCHLDKSTILVVEWNNDQAEYVVVVPQEPPDRRQLESNLQWPRHVRGERNVDRNRAWTEAMHVDLQSRSLRTLPRRRVVEDSDEKKSSSTTSFLVRSCHCGDLEPVYCPVDLDACSITGRDDDGSATVGCFQNTKRTEDLAQTCLFLSMVWFALLFCCLSCTECGRVVIHFLLSKLDATHNERLADFLLERRRHFAFLLIQRNVHHHRWLTGSFHRGPLLGRDASGDEPDGPLPTSLALKTHIFHQTDKMERHDGQDDDEDTQQCIICLQHLQNGDRVGDLLCGHEFHAICLKTWLQRRNTCPLCNATHVATPRCDDDDDDKNKPNRPRAQTQSTASEEGTFVAQLANSGGDGGGNPHHGE